MKRTVLDTNIIISSALGGALVLILERWDKGEFTVTYWTQRISLDPNSLWARVHGLAARIKGLK